MKQCILYSHAGSDNHGCEALLRTSFNVIGNIETVYSGNVKADKKYGAYIEGVDFRADKTLKKEGLFFEFCYALKYKIFKDDKLYFKKIYREFLKEIKKDRLYISIGGDNYCYHFSEWLEVLNLGINSAGAKSVLWGCSINSDELENKSVVNDLKRYSLITARESITYNLLKSKLPNTWIELVPDTAFLLPVQSVDLPSKFIEGKTVGINISPVIINSSNNSRKLFNNIIDMINHIIDTTAYQIALIPHVVIPGNDDREIHKKIYDSIEDKSRIMLVPDASCIELKGIISKCCMFIGARTHATIAAYSTMVPTLVIGYSVKSLGIAKDLFGSIDNYVISAQNISSSNQLINAFDWLNYHQDEIREYLKKQIPQYICNIKCASKFLEKISCEK